MSMNIDVGVLPDISGSTIGILGGTGDQGRGLGYRFARSGLTVRIGSRSQDRGQQAAAELAQLPGVVPGTVSGGDNCYACGGDLVVVAVPMAGHAALLASLADDLRGRIVVDCVNPIGFDKRGPYCLPVLEGSAAQQAEAVLPSSRVCAAFHHVSAAVLLDVTVDRLDLDVLVLGDDREAVAQVQALAFRIAGVRGVFAGRLRNAGQVEALTANLIAINRRYRTSSGIRITGMTSR
jgi:8-hydroxy-5-deazaflavin:NADPH oxidoreductase